MIEIAPNRRKGNQFKADDLVCHCFNYTKRDIEKDFTTNRRSMIYEKITLEKNRGDATAQRSIQNAGDAWRMSTRWWND